MIVCSCYMCSPSWALTSNNLNKKCPCLSFTKFCSDLGKTKEDEIFFLLHRIVVPTVIKLWRPLEHSARWCDTLCMLFQRVANTGFPASCWRGWLATMYPWRDGWNTWRQVAVPAAVQATCEHCSFATDGANTSRPWGRWCFWCSHANVQVCTNYQ